MGRTKPQGLVLLPDNGRDPNYPIEMGLDGYQAGAVRVFLTTSDPDNPDASIPDLTRVMRPEEFERYVPAKGMRERFVYRGKVYER